MRLRRLPTLALGLALAAPVSGQMQSRLDIAYGPADASPADPRQLDIYSPGEQLGERLPVVVYVHGGGWYGGDKARLGSKPEWLTSSGHLLVSLNYRLLPEARHPTHARDVAEALAWVHRHIDEHGGDPDRLVLMGHSSGGHLAALVATDERYLEPYGLAPESLAGVISLDTLAFDLATLIPGLPSDRLGLYLAVFGRGDSRWRRASPLHHVGIGPAPPPFLLLAAGEDGATQRHGAAFGRALEEAGTNPEIHVFADETHGSINSRLGQDGHRPTAVVDAFLERLSKR